LLIDISWGSKKNLSNKKINTFEDLKCWQACRELRLFVSKKVVPILPIEEKYSLREQILKAARSTTANTRPVK
jgi:hypothetical protein